jgi:hypothetical protein
MRKGFLIYKEMRKFLVIYEEAVVSYMWLCNCSLLNFLIYEKCFFSFLSVWGRCSFPLPELISVTKRCHRRKSTLTWWWHPLVIAGLHSVK